MFLFQKGKVVSREGGVVTLAVAVNVHVSSDQEGAATGGTKQNQIHQNKMCQRWVLLASNELQIMSKFLLMFGNFGHLFYRQPKLLWM